MRFVISGKNLEVSQGLREAVESKLGKLERYFTPDTEVIVTLSLEKERQKIEVTIPVKGSIIRSEQTSTDMYVSIDLVRLTQKGNDIWSSGSVLQILSNERYCGDVLARKTYTPNYLNHKPKMVQMV